MNIPFHRVNAFTCDPFGGNPAGVCILDKWLPDDVLQSIATENNMAETAFVIATTGNPRPLRWFTPAIEMDLCGHATLATAYVLAKESACQREDCITFDTKSGLLTCTLNGNLVEMNFPSRPAEPTAATEILIRGLGAEPTEVFKARDYMAVFESQSQIENIDPDFVALAQLDCLGIIATAPGDDCDFVSRVFAPRAGIPEDPVTGSAHSTLIPYWAAKLGKKELHARQISTRGGELFCQDLGARVSIAGNCTVYMSGELFVPEP